MQVSPRTLFAVFVTVLCFTLILFTLPSGKFSFVNTNHSASSYIRHIQPLHLWRTTLEKENEQSIRLQQLERVCKEKPNYGLMNNNSVKLQKTMSHLLVDDYHKVLYCYVPKTGCTLWKGLLMNMSQLMGKEGLPEYVHAAGSLNKYGIRELKTYPTEEILFRLQTYYKFLFVRHPLTRLVSTFRNKFAGEENGFSGYIPRMLKYTRKLNKTIFVNETKKYNLTFTEFLEYTFESQDGPSFLLSEHWDNFERLCSPCFVNYDYIGKQETLDNDTRQILLKAFRKNDVKLSVPNWTGSDISKARRYFREVPDVLKAKVVKYYSRDAELFNYNLNGC